MSPMERCLSLLLTEKCMSDLLKFSAFPLRGYHESESTKCVKEGPGVSCRAVDPTVGFSHVHDGVYTVMNLNQCVSQNHWTWKVHDCIIPFIWCSKPDKVSWLSAVRITVVLEKEVTRVDPGGAASLVAYVAYSVPGHLISCSFVTGVFFRSFIIFRSLKL